MSLIENSKEAKDFFDKGYERAKERFENADYDGAIQDCWNLIQKLNKDPETGKGFEDYTPDELTIIAGRLSVLKAYLGPHASKAVLNTNNSYIFKKFQQAAKRKLATDRLEELGKKTTVDAIQSEVAQMSIREEQDWAFNQEYADRMVNLFKSIEWILTSIGWRIKEINSERYEVQYQSSADFNN